MLFSGCSLLCWPRLTGRYTHVTLHHLMDTVDLKDAGVRHARVYRWPEQRDENTALVEFGLGSDAGISQDSSREIWPRQCSSPLTRQFSREGPEYPDFSRRGNPEHRILAFGKWGTYKRLELMIEAFEIVSEAVPNTKLVVAEATILKPRAMWNR